MMVNGNKTATTGRMSSTSVIGVPQLVQRGRFCNDDSAMPAAPFRLISIEQTDSQYRHLRFMDVNNSEWEVWTPGEVVRFTQEELDHAEAFLSRKNWKDRTTDECKHEVCCEDCGDCLNCYGEDICAVSGRPHRAETLIHPV
jgi:hypothetical protein